MPLNHARTPYLHQRARSTDMSTPPTRFVVHNAPEPESQSFPGRRARRAGWREVTAEMRQLHLQRLEREADELMQKMTEAQDAMWRARKELQDFEMSMPIWMRNWPTPPELLRRNRGPSSTVRDFRQTEEEGGMYNRQTRYRKLLRERVLQREQENHNACALWRSKIEELERFEGNPCSDESDEQADSSSGAELERFQEDSSSDESDEQPDSSSGAELERFQEDSSSDESDEQPDSSSGNQGTSWRTHHHCVQPPLTTHAHHIYHNTLREQV